MPDKKPSFPRPRLGVSSCIVGNRVRYNGVAKTNHWLLDQLGAFVEFVPVCPEVSAGLGVPRDTIRLQRTETGVRALENKTGKDLTDLLDETAKDLVQKHCLDLDGYVLMQKSPTCGLERVKLYDHNGVPSNQGKGRYAAELQNCLPHIPLVEAGRLSDPVQREHFVLRLFTFARFHRTETNAAALQDFHKRHKLLLLAYNQELYRELGRIAAGTEKDPIEQRIADYKEILAKTLASNFSHSSMTNALAHVYGFVKAKLGDNQRKDILDAIDRYKEGLVPLLVPLTLMQFAAQADPEDYLADQVIFAPYPEDLKVRNAV